MIDDISDEYERQSGSVQRFEQGKLIVRVERDPADCEGCKSCAVKALCRGRDSGYMELPVPYAGKPALAVGDTVKIAYRAPNAAVAAIVMFLPALLGLFFGGFIGHWIAGESDANFLLGCLIGFVLGLGTSFILTKSVSALRPDVKLLTK